MDIKLNADASKHEGGEPDKFKAQNSNESVASVMFPWRVQRNEARRPIVSRNETGRTITTTGFYMCLMSVMLLTTGIGLTAVSGWTLIYRIPYVYLSGGSIFLGTDSFTLIAGVLSFPCCWIAWICHNNKKYYTILPVLMVLLSFAICMLSTGVGIAFVNKSKMNFNHTEPPPKLSAGHYRSFLNETMTSAMIEYDVNPNFRWSWNSVQKRLRCCGVNKADDWLEYRKSIPNSCYSNEETSESKMPFTRNCLDALSLELSWEVCFLIGLIGLLWVSICLMSTTLVISFFDKLSTNIQGSELHIKQILNGTMTSALKLYETKFRARLSWDIVQRRLKCCGKDGPADWLQLRSFLPCSCFLNNAASSPKVLFVQGCLDKIIRDLILENSFLIGICLVTMGVHIATLVLAALMYLRNRLSRKSTVKTVS